MTDCSNILGRAERRLFAAVAVTLFLGICFAVTAVWNIADAVPFESDGKINPNNASLYLLQELPGIGEKRANAIIDCRQKSAAGFSQPQDMQKVNGIGEITVNKIKQLLKFE